MLFSSPSIKPVFVLEQAEDAILHPAKRVFVVIVLPFEDVAFREVFDRTDEQTLLNEEVTVILLQRIYETISDKPEKMIKYENAPRPH